VLKPKSRHTELTGLPPKRVRVATSVKFRVMRRVGRANRPQARVGTLSGSDSGVSSRPRSRDGRARRICVVLLPIEPYSSAGGAIATVARNVAHEWEEVGHSVTVIAPQSDTPAYTVGRSVTIDIHHGPRLPERVSNRIHRSDKWDWPSYRRYLKAVARAIQSLDRAPDVLVVHNDLQILPELAPLVSGVETVLWLHNSIRTARPDARSSLEDVDRIVAVSDYIARWTEQYYGLTSGTVCTAHNGVDLERFRPQEGRCRHSGTALQVVCHGRIDPSKGFHLVVDAVRRLRSRGIEIDLTLAGGLQAFGITGAAAAAYRDTLLSSLEGVGGTYRGRIDPGDVPDLLRGADVACAPSMFPEPFCLSALEAMASGCALIASDRGGIPEACGDAGILVDPDNPGSIEDALAALATDRSFLAERQRSARLRAERFPWSAPAAIALGGDPERPRP